jgi:hypothetical protein
VPSSREETQLQNSTTKRRLLIITHKAFGRGTAAGSRHKKVLVMVGMILGLFRANRNFSRSLPSSSLSKRYFCFSSYHCIYIYIYATWGVITSRLKLFFFFLEDLTARHASLICSKSHGIKTSPLRRQLRTTSRRVK